jgi:hypothetical protein
MAGLCDFSGTYAPHRKAVQFQKPCYELWRTALHRLAMRSQYHIFRKNQELNLVKP